MRRMILADAIETLYDLNTGVVGTGAARHERPHKPVLLLAILDAIATGQARPDNVPWSQWLRERFASYFALVRSHNDECTPENPFFYLKTDRFWRPVEVTAQGETPLGATPLVRDADTGRVFARLAPEWQMLLADFQVRLHLRDALVSRYFPAAHQQLRPLFLEPAAMDAEPQVAEDGDDLVLPGRSSAFRRRVLEVYDYQCAACGLRIWLAEHDLTFVDAAHLVPFSLTRNDHPTNGLALCKNHHWALDQRLIAPDPDGVWRVSRHIEPRRSRGEEDLARLAGERLLAPGESAFAPTRENLEWRFQRLLS
jgi:putative restriction endonuclease